MSAPLKVGAHEPPGDSIERLAHRLEHDPNAHSLRLKRVLLLRRAGRLKEAERELQRARDRAPELSAVAYEEGMLWLAREQASKASEAFERATVLDDPPADLFFQRGLLLTADGAFEAASREYARAVQLRPRVEYVLRWAESERERGELGAAAEALRAGLRQSGDSVVLRERLVRSELEADRPERALYEAWQLLLRDPDNSRWWVLRAEVYAQAGAPMHAQGDRERALELADRRMEARPIALLRLERARVLAALGRRCDAYNELQQVRADAPDLELGRSLASVLGLDDSGALGDCGGAAPAAAEGARAK